MYCELMAEYRLMPDGRRYPRSWHMVRQDSHVALCGQILVRDAATTSMAQIDQVQPEEVCPRCWSRYRAGGGARIGPAPF